MKLAELKPQFFRHAVEAAGPELGRPMPDGTTQWGGFPTDVFHNTDNLAEADGITFLCPKCFASNAGPIGTHSIMIFFEGGKAPPHLGTNKDGQTVRWRVTGTGYGDLVTVPSILQQAGCQWHGYIGGSGGECPGDVVTC